MQRATFARRVYVAVGIVMLAFLLLALLWAATDVLLLLFAAILVACFLRGTANVFSQYTRVPIGWSLGIVVTLLCGATTAAVWLLAPQVAAQVDDLSRGLTQSFQQMRAYLGQYDWGRRILAQVQGVAELAQRGNLLSRVTGAFSSTLGMFANAILVAFIGLYLAVAPGTYLAGLVRLFPKPAARPDERGPGNGRRNTAPLARGPRHSYGRERCLHRAWSLDPRHPARAHPRHDRRPAELRA